MPLKSLQYLGPFGNQLANSMRDDNWGSPQITAEAAEEAPAFKMPIPQWAPGEFEEWKNAHVMGIPTQYGWRQQQAYKMRKNPGQQVYSQAGLTNPALMGLKGLL